MRNGKAHFDAAGHKAKPGKDARRPDDVRNIQDFLARSLMNYRCYSPSEVGTDRYSDLIVLQNGESVLLGYRSVGRLGKAYIGVHTIGIKRGWDRTGW